MSLETSLFNRLTTQLSTAPVVKIYPGVAPQNTSTPYIVYSKVSADKKYEHSGPSNLSLDRLQISVFSSGYLTAKNVVARVITAMEGWGDAQAVFKANEIDMYEPETKTYHIPVDFLVWHNM
jgi:hypothetical protein